MIEREAAQPNIRPRVTAVVGAKAAGKDELAHYLVQHHGALALEVGAFARKLAEEAEANEPHLQYDAAAKNLADFGAEYVIVRLVAEITERPADRAQQPKALVIMGVRTPAEAAVLKAYFGFDLLLVYVKGGSEETRYDRVQRRSLPTDPRDLQDFKQHDAQLKAEYRLTETAELADITLWNNGSLAAYHQQIETYIVPHLFPQINKQ